MTVLFCDVTGSTALGESTDPEALRALLARYFERMQGIVESHGGTVEKFIGDAVMAVFGVPVAHEDDALRACRTAAEMRDALPELGVQARIGVNTGEVVTGTSERLATGDAVNVAARLEQAAEPGEVLLGVETMRLVEDAVEAEPVELLQLKGKREPVPAFRLFRVGEVPERPHGGVFVGREREQDEIADAWVRAGAEQRCELVTVVAEAGVGKTRLAAEALDRLGARVVRGRCLSYGEGITYSPVVEVVRRIEARPSDRAAAAAIASLLGETEAGTSAEEIAWAFRKLLEEQAPLVCVFEDIHWGEETFLDLVEHVALLSAGAQVLLLCTARPELLERRHSWPVALRLAPLEPAEAGRLVPESLPAGLREKIARAAGGNPLFLTEMAAMAETADGEMTVPPNLRALLIARLDQVDAAERRVLERGAVEGEIFHRGAVQALAPEERQVTARLAGLVRRELVRPERAQIPGDDGFRFRHVLIRDAAYDALPKSDRAELHGRFAAWLEEHGQNLVELDEILGHHLERAVLYRAELGQPDTELAERAGERLAAAGRRAFWRGDNGAAARLLGRALTLLRPIRLDVALELDFSAVQPTQREAAAVADAAAERAYGAGDRAGEAAARVAAALYRLHGAEAAVEELEALVQVAVPLLEQVQDHVGLVHVWHALGFGVANIHGRFEEFARAEEEALRHSRLAGERRSTLFFSRRRLPPDRGLPMRRSRPSTRCCQRRLTPSRSGAEAGSSPCSAASMKRGRLHTRQASGSSSSPATTGQPTFCLPRSRRSPVTTRQLLITSVAYASGTSRRAGKTSLRRSHRGSGSRCAPSVATTRPSRWRERAASSATCTTFQCRRFGDRCSRSSTLTAVSPVRASHSLAKQLRSSNGRTGSACKRTRSAAWPRCSHAPASPTRPKPRSNRRSNATSASATSSWPSEHAHG